MSELIEIFAGIFLSRFQPKKRTFNWDYKVEDDREIIQGTEVTQLIPKVIIFGFLALNLLLAFLVFLSLLFLLEDLAGNFLLIVATAVITLLIFIIFVITGSAVETKTGKKLWYDFRPIKMTRVSNKLTITRLYESGDVKESIDISWENIRGISLEQRDMRVIHLKIKVDKNIIPKPITLMFPQRAHNKLSSVVKDIGEKNNLQINSKGYKIEYRI